MDLGITGRTAAVAAGTAGLGLAVAGALVEEGVEVVVCGRDPDRVSAAVAGLGGGARGLVCDVSTADGGREFVERTESMLGRVDILVANGGGPPPGGWADVSEDQFRSAFEANLLATVAMCTAAVPGMRERRWGRVLAITSISVRQPIGHLILSNTARAGLTAYLSTLARDVAADGVTVNSIQPGTHATDRITQLYGGSLEAAASGIPAGFLGSAADFGRIAVTMVADHARFMTGVHLHVDGGAYQGLL